MATGQGHPPDPALAGSGQSVGKQTCTDNALRAGVARRYTKEDPADTPRSSNGRTAAFGAVNRGSNPCRGAILSAYQLPTPIVLTAALYGTSDIPNNSKVFGAANLSGWRGGFVGVRAQPPGFRPDPKFSLANSPVSPVDRLRLLTAPSNVGSRVAIYANSDPRTVCACLRQELYPCISRTNDRLETDFPNSRHCEQTRATTLPLAL